MRGVYWQADAWEEYIEIQKDRSLTERINLLIKDIMRNGYRVSYGKPEMLKGDFSGYASIRIDKKNRLIFKVSASEVIILSCTGHYGDK